MVPRPAGSAALVLVDAATPLHPGPALFEAMLEGWRCQHLARRLSPGIIRDRERVVRRFAEFTTSWPWQWRSDQLEAWVGGGLGAFDSACLRGLPRFVPRLHL